MLSFFYSMVVTVPQEEDDFRTLYQVVSGSTDQLDQRRK